MCEMPFLRDRRVVGVVDFLPTAILDLSRMGERVDTGFKRRADRLKDSQRMDCECAGSAFFSCWCVR